MNLTTRGKAMIEQRLVPKPQMAAASKAKAKPTQQVQWGLKTQTLMTLMTGAWMM